MLVHEAHEAPIQQRLTVVIKVEKNSQKQELNKQITDLTDEISRLKKQIAQQAETIKQFPVKVADYEGQIGQLKKENFGLKNSRNEELEAVAVV